MITRLSKTEATRVHVPKSTSPTRSVSVILIEPSDQLSHKRLRQLVASSLPQLARFRSRQPRSFADRLLAALRNQFGGHAIKRPGS